VELSPEYYCIHSFTHTDTWRVSCVCLSLCAYDSLCVVCMLVVQHCNKCSNESQRENRLSFTC